MLAELAEHVYTIEIVPELAERSRTLLTELGYTNIIYKCGDGYQGFPEYAPFDAIIVTCAPDAVPQPLIDQLADNGRLVIPVGEKGQLLKLFTKENGRLIEHEQIPVRFVPMLRKK